MSLVESIDGIGDRVKNRKRVEEAVEVQDRLRAKENDWNGQEEIKKWRRKR